MPSFSFVSVYNQRPKVQHIRHVHLAAVACMVFVFGGMNWLLIHDVVAATLVQVSLASTCLVRRACSGVMYPSSLAAPMLSLESVACCPIMGTLSFFRSRRDWPFRRV